jgi:hypothetical protein
MGNPVIPPPTPVAIFIFENPVLCNHLQTMTPSSLLLKTGSLQFF